MGNHIYKLSYSGRQSLRGLNADLLRGRTPTMLASLGPGPAYTDPMKAQQESHLKADREPRVTYAWWKAVLCTEYSVGLCRSSSSRWVGNVLSMVIDGNYRRMLLARRRWEGMGSESIVRRETRGDGRIRPQGFVGCMLEESILG